MCRNCPDRDKIVVKRLIVDMDQTENIIEIIRECPLFKGMPDEDIGKIILKGSIERTEEGSVLAPGMMYIILDGSILIEKEASDGRRVAMSLAKAPAVINAAAVLLDENSLSTLRAGAESCVLSLSEEVVRQAILGGGTFALNFAEFLTDRVSFLNHKISSLAGYSAFGRLVMYLREHECAGEVTIPMSLTAFAGNLGVGRASLYRAFDSLEAQKLIEKSGRKIRITGNLNLAREENS